MAGAIVRARQRGLLFALVAVVLLGGVWWFFARGVQDARAPHRAPQSNASDSDDPRQRERSPRERDGHSKNELGAAVAALEAALQRGDAHAAQDAAAALRRLLRRDAEARRGAAARLLAGETPRVLRMVLALVLGTLPGGEQDAVLIDALERFAKDTAVARCILLALGATRDPPDDDDVFGLGDRPGGVHGPGGVGITVRSWRDVTYA